MIDNARTVLQIRNRKDRRKHYMEIRVVGLVLPVLVGEKIIVESINQNKKDAIALAEFREFLVITQPFWLLKGYGKRFENHEFIKEADYIVPVWQFKGREEERELLKTLKKLKKVVL